MQLLSSQRRVNELEARLATFEKDSQGSQATILDLREERTVMLEYMKEEAEKVMWCHQIGCKLLKEIVMMKKFEEVERSRESGYNLLRVKLEQFADTDRLKTKRSRKRSRN